jgi:hypothetical protein
MPRSSPCSHCGRAEPAPPRGGPSKARGPCGGNPGITRRAFFSEGRTLCVRMARPHECRGIPFSPDDEAKGRLAYRADVSVKPVPSLRACGARPSAGAQTQRGLRSDLGLGNDGKSDFLGGTHSVRPCGRAPRMPRHCISTRCRGQRPVAYRAHASVKPVPSLRACGARPSAGGQTQRGLRSDLGLGNDGKSDFLGGTHSVRPRIRAGCKPGYGMITEK